MLIQGVDGLADPGLAATAEQHVAVEVDDVPRLRRVETEEKRMKISTVPRLSGNHLAIEEILRHLAAHRVRVVDVDGFQGRIAAARILHDLAQLAQILVIIARPITARNGLMRIDGDDDALDARPPQANVMRQQLLEMPDVSGIRADLCDDFLPSHTACHSCFFSAYRSIVIHADAAVSPPVYRIARAQKHATAHAIQSSIHSRK